MSGGIVYKADGNTKPADGYKWRPSIHMPREAARIFLRVTGVRVERVREISEEGAQAEGFRDRNDFLDCWENLYTRQNQWVWVYDFERCEKPEEGESQ